MDVQTWKSEESSGWGDKGASARRLPAGGSVATAAAGKQARANVGQRAKGICEEKIFTQTTQAELLERREGNQAGRKEGQSLKKKIRTESPASELNGAWGSPQHLVRVPFVTLAARKLGGL